MRDFSEMMATIKGVAQKLNVLAIAQNGSRTNKLAPVDQWQDFDIVYVVPDVAPYVNDQRWLADFGELLIMQQPDSRDFLQGTQTTRYHFLLQFADGNRIDLTFLAQSDVAAWAAEDTLAEILVDAQQIMPQLAPATDQTHWVKRPTFLDFSECCNEFFWVALYVAKGLARGELLYATDHFYDNCRGELLRLLSWKVGFAHDFAVSVGKNHKYLANFLPVAQMEKIYQLQDLTSVEKVWANLVDLEALFMVEAKLLAANFSEPTDFTDYENVLCYTLEWAAKAKAEL